MPPSQTGFSLLTQTLEDLDIEYLVGGSVASSLYSLPRATMDVDLLAEICPHHLSKLPAGFAVLNNTAPSPLNLIHMESGNKFDIFPPTHPFHFSELERRV